VIVCPAIPAKRARARASMAGERSLISQSAPGRPGISAAPSKPVPQPTSSTRGWGVHPCATIIAASFSATCR
ncbi:hypothetical protein KXV85_003892, partial [Aspergillus fumigatus]